eukprot:gene18714-20603_t
MSDSQNSERNSWSNCCKMLRSSVMMMIIITTMQELRLKCMFFLKPGGDHVAGRAEDEIRRKRVAAQPVKRQDCQQALSLSNGVRRRSTTRAYYCNSCLVGSLNTTMTKLLMLSWIIAVIIAQSAVKAESSSTAHSSSTKASSPEEEDDLDMTFARNTVIELKLNSRLVEVSSKPGQQDTRITLLFKTTQPSATMFVASGLNGDFIFIEMVRGKPRIVLGGKEGESSRQIIHHDILLQDNLCDNEWHQLELHVLQDFTHARVDTLARSELRTVKRLQIDRRIVLGGLGQQEASYLNVSVSKRNYTGCLSYVMFNGIDVLQTLKKTHSELDWACQTTDKDDLINFDQKGSNIQIRNPINTDLKFGLWFRTYHKCGVLATNIGLPSIGTRFLLYFQNNVLKLRLNGRMVISIASESAIDFGSWHKIEIAVTNRSAILIFDKRTKVYRFMRLRSADLGDTISIGNRIGNVPNFMGWIRNLKMDGNGLTYRNASMIKDVSIGVYRMVDRCYPNPCNNNGVCVQNENGSHCDCTNTGYTGNRCLQKDYKRTCAEYYKSGRTRSGNYVIKPGSIPFNVFCNMDQAQGPTTIVQHASNKQRKAIYQSTSSSNRFFYHEINYAVPIEQLGYLIDTSARCQQRVEYYCSKSTLMFSNDKTAAMISRYGARWYSRNGFIQRYWGGAEKGSLKCACGMNNSCYDNRLGCNCDAMDGQWRSDGGYLRFKDDLPVTKLQFSKRNTNPASAYSLGPLECFGNQTEAVAPEKATTQTQVTKQTKRNDPATKSTTRVPTTLVQTSTTRVARTTSSSTRLSTTKTSIRHGFVTKDADKHNTDKSTSKTRISNLSSISRAKETAEKPATIASSNGLASTRQTKNTNNGHGNEDTDSVLVTSSPALPRTGGSLSAAEIAATPKTATRKIASVLVVHQPAANHSEQGLSSRQMFILIALISSLTLFTILLIVIVLRQRIFAYASSKKQPLSVELKENDENPKMHSFQPPPNNNSRSSTDGNDGDRSPSRSMLDMHKIEIVKIGSVFGKQSSTPSESETSMNSFDTSRYLEISEEGSDTGSYMSYTKPKGILKSNKFLLTSRPRSEGHAFDTQEVIGLIHISKEQRKTSHEEENSELLGNSSSDNDNFVDERYLMAKSKIDDSMQFYQGNNIRQHVQRSSPGRNESIEADTGFLTDSSLSSNSRKSLGSSTGDESNDEFYMARKHKKSSKRSVRFAFNEIEAGLKTPSKRGCEKVQDRCFYQEGEDEVFS